ncbi:MAG TPA: metallophosphoesterase family protein [Gemmataceae bacterium]|jgi:serine/threonine protein phosphatase 1
MAENPRILAVGDIHGCSRALDLLLADVNPRGDDTVVTLGDYIDRGPDSKGVLDRLLDLGQKVRLVPLRGNHEVMLLLARESRDERNMWLKCGGEAAMLSYGRNGRPGTLDDIPERHWEFVAATCVDWHEEATHFFVHAGALPDIPLAAQPHEILFWESFADRGPHECGKVMVCGHTPQKSGVPLHIGHAVCIDTWAYGGGWLTCLDVTTGHVWQANQRGDRRTGQLDGSPTPGGFDP